MRGLHREDPAGCPDIDLVIKLKTAERLGVTVPSLLLATADGVIE